MRQFWKINIYETQMILYWILGELILHLGQWHWLGWVSIIYGWTILVHTLVYGITHRKELEDEFK